MSTMKLSKEINDFLEKPTTRDFLQAARQVISILENANISIQEFTPKIHTALLELYLCGHKLEIIELKYSNEESDFPEDKLFDNKNVNLISELGENVFYWEIFDPTYSDKEAVQGWLVDDFSDIYRDLKIEMAKIEIIGTDEAVEDALWQLRFGFYSHWGHHCINALRYLHFLYYSGKQTL